MIPMSLRGDLWTQELAVKFVLPAVTQLMQWSLNFEPFSWRTGALLLKRGTEIHAYWNYGKKGLQSDCSRELVRSLPLNQESLHQKQSQALFQEGLTLTYECLLEELNV